MKKIIVTVGMSNSGKSTWAHQQWMYNSDLIIINRDKIRELLFGFTEDSVVNYYTLANMAKCEKMVTRYEDTLINEALEMGKTPIVDATHLKRAYLERFKYWNVEVDVQFFDVTLKEAQIRNAGRLRKVPEDVLIKQYNQYVGLRNELDKNPIDFTPVTIDYDLLKTPCFIFDIDGTLAHMDRDVRSPYDWGKVGLDTVDTPTASISRLIEFHSNNSIDDKTKIIICTGRDGICLKETKDWLKKYDIPYHEIYIRAERDQRPDWVVKEEMWREISKNHRIIGMFDDRLQVVRRARALGLKVFNVEYNNF